MSTRIGRVERQRGGTALALSLFSGMLVGLGAGLCTDTYAQAAAQSPADTARLDNIDITAHHDHNAVGSSDAASEGRVRTELLKSRPAQRPGEVLEWVPGMVVTQHSGDGKANQYFLRGYNLDHGTDFATSVNAVPVNMPTHAHGQGYSDLNFLIPELVDHIAYRKGPYFATQGDFSSAGAADIVYRRRVDTPFAHITLGGHGYRRGLVTNSTELAPDRSLLGAWEWMGNDGPWTLPERLQRRNGVLSLTDGNRSRGWSATVMVYDARWQSTDQVPQRLIDAGVYQGQSFNRFDAIDATDGGSTSRYSVSGEWHAREAEQDTRVSAYLMRYRLKLFSNFTYAMDRPDTGDQFLQSDQRTVIGLSASRAWVHMLGGLDARSELGVRLRHDAIRGGLYDTQARVVTATVREDDVRQTGLGVYGQTQLMLAPWLRSVIGMRVDATDARVNSLMLAANSGHSRATQLSPKLSLIAGPWARTELFLNAGRGLHSNDARGTTQRVDPRSGTVADAVPGLVPSLGWELGVRSDAVKGLQTSLAWWHLRSASELVYVGDAGTTEAAGASTRRGIEWNTHWTPTTHWLLDADLAWTHARFNQGGRIPNAVDQVASVAASLQDVGPWSASLQWRYLGSSALLEDNRMRSQPSSTVNLRLGRDLRDLLSRHAAITLDVFNLGNRAVNDIQYAYASQLRGEAVAVVDRLVHPGEPRSLRLTLTLGL